MILTKKHVEKIAEILNKHYWVIDDELMNPLLEDLCTYFESDNELFDREKFLDKVKELI